MVSPIRQRTITLVAVSLVIVAVWPASSAMSASYGKLVVRHAASPTSTLQTHFVHVRPSRSFVLVLTEPTGVQLALGWSVHCFNPAGRESGGAEGNATVVSGHWVKRVRADWIKHPAYCTGSITGLAGASPVLVRVFAV